MPVFFSHLHIRPSDDEKRGAQVAAKAAAKANEMDPDHALLLRSVQVLFRSQNSGVVLAAASLFQARRSDATIIASATANISNHACIFIEN